MTVGSAPFEAFSFDLEHPACLVPMLPTCLTGGSAGATGGALRQAASCLSHDSIPYDDNWPGAQYVNPLMMLPAV